MIRRTPAIAMLVFAALMWGCSDQGLATTSPEIEVTWSDDYCYDEEICFGSVTMGTFDEVDVYITNTGNGNLDISDIWLDQQFPGLLEDGESGMLEPEEALVVHLRFTPEANSQVSDLLRIDNSATEESIDIPVTGLGDGDPVPDIYCDPNPGDFGDVQIGTDAPMVFTVGNAGFSDLVIPPDGVIITGTNAGMYAITDNFVSGVTYPPNDAPSTLTVQFSPPDLQEYNAQMEITSNDPDENPLIVPLTGNGSTPGGDGPIAICDVTPNPVHPPFEFASWIGHDSYDPDGYAITTYQWTLINTPPGSSATMPMCNNTPDCGPFQPDLAGTYTAQLYIVNDINMSASCTVDLEAEPTEDLWIEMYWTYPDDDMDLHLLAPNGQLQSQTDCYYGNCVGAWNNLDWGQQNYPGDDPSLDMDDIPGTGPENINIADPQQGTFTVVVHDYHGSTGDSPGANPTTVNVYVNGTLAWSDTRDINQENSYNHYCTVAWPTGVVTPL